ncbi:MAG: zinc-ribbon and DUF3426 domain-containing protein [Leptothrix sp. (in: b-proteobacteria)]
MSLATSCSDCGTVFKVIEDQLKVSEGWVRCGHCHQVFNALEGLFDLEARSPIHPPFQVHREGSPAAPPQFPAPSAPALPAPAVDARSPGAALRGAPSPMHPGDWGSAHDPKWIETRPAMFSDVRALQDRGHSRGPAQPDRFAAAEPVADEGSAADAVIGASHAEAPAEQPRHKPDHAPSPLSVQHVDLDIADTVFMADDPFSIPGSGVDTLPWQALAPLGEEAAADADEAADHIEQEADAASLSGSSGDACPRPDTPAGERAAYQPAPEPECVETPQAAVATGTGTGTAVSEPSPDASALPAFMQGRHAADAPSARARFGMGIATGLCAAMLVVQLASWQRDLWVALWPDLGPPAEWLCARLGCEVNAPRQLDALVLDNTTLTRPPGVDGYRLQVLLRNRAEHVVRAPHLELSLSDAAGSIIVRRILAPADFQQPAQLASSSEASWGLELVCSDKRVAGYTVSAFYP